MARGQPHRWDDGTFKAKDKQKVKAGRKGGKATGESKARTGATNARFDPTAERRPCCGVKMGRAHKKTCPNHRHFKLNALRDLRTESIVVKEYDAADFPAPAGVMMFVRGCTAVCVCCKKTGDAASFPKVHKEDLTLATMRAVCAECQ